MHDETARNETPRLWLNCWDNTEWLEQTYAVVEITPAWAAQTLARVRLMAALRQQEGGKLYQMEYWDWTPEWVTRPCYSADDAQPQEQLCDDIENSEAVYCPPGQCPWPTVTDDERQSVECVTLLVQEDGVSWECRARHADGVMIGTTTIPLRDLEHYARGEVPEAAVIID